MADLRKCSRCTSTIELKYFSISRKGDHYKCCDNCRNKLSEYNKKPDVQDHRKQQKSQPLECENCGSTRNKGSMWLHQRRYYCKTYHMETKPSLEEWVINQDYDTLLHQYKELLKEITDKKQQECND